MRKRGKKAAPGDATTPAPYRQLTDFWTAQKRRRTPNYVFLRSDGAHFGEIWARAGNDVELAKRAIVAYLADDDRFYEGHPAKLLRRDIEKFLHRATSANGGFKRNGQQRRQGPNAGFCQGAAELPRDTVNLVG